MTISGKTASSIVLLLPVAGYQNSEFLAAGKRLGVEVITVSDYCRALAPFWGLPPLASVPFDRPLAALPRVLRALKGRPDAVLAADDHGLELAACLRAHYGLPGNAPDAIRVTRDKYLFRKLLAQGGFCCPEVQVLAEGQNPADLAAALEFPVVVKPRRLSTSRGVVRADSPEAFLRAVGQARRIQADAARDDQQLGLLVERFIPGREYALEGLLKRGELRVLALFDKPDPLDGPYFEETLYVTPSRLPMADQKRVAESVQRACAQAGLTEGPVHAEMRLNSEGVFLLEIAARSIGGLCGRILRHALGMSLEELILRAALDWPIPDHAAAVAAGVMMIPIPCRGIYRGVQNLEAARRVPGVEGIEITALPGQRVSPAPEGSSYLGFIFSRGDRPEGAEAALRAAHGQLAFDIRPEIRLDKASEGA
ncbi:MAG: ATP-grasp domain-containing protein [Betaproteobacteria bacterium]|nr:ATP-grasp domain-containing protein [Betaproteobacteria bacterium]